MLRNPSAIQPSRLSPGAVLTGCFLLLVLLTVSDAQVPSAITPDGTLGTVVTPAGRVFNITGGTRPGQGPNLFHSFDQFNVGTGDTAHFAGHLGIDNIIGRVTGGSASLIDGRLQSDASLFLLNPSGLMFGPNATLDVNGSFHASTADMLRFADAATFSAHLNEKSTLTVASPAAFGFLSENPAGIAIEDSRLEVPDSETISLVGGDIKIVGRHSADDDLPTVSAPSGRINLVSIASSGNVTIGAPEHVPTITVDNAERLGVIEVSQTALLSVSGDGGGTVVIRGGRLLVDNANIFANTTGDSRGAPIGIDVLVTEAMILRDGAFVTTDMVGAGTVGNIEVRAPRLEVTTGALLGSRAFAGSTGDTGTVTVIAKGLVELINGGQISSSTFAQGNAGDVEVQAGELRIDDFGTPKQITGISSDTFGAGNAGTVTVTVQGLVELLNGGIITSSSLSAQGNAGGVEIKADRLRIDHFGIPLQFTGIASDTTYGASGDAGTVTITVQGLVELLNGGIITTSSSLSTQGNAGDVEVQAGELRIDNFSTPDQATGITSTANSGSLGNAGMVMVTVEGLVELINGAEITSSTFAQGNAGSVEVEIGELRIDGSGNPSQFTGIASQAGQGSTGKAGTVTVTAEGILELLNGAEITSSTFAQGNAGSVVVQASELRIDDFGTPGQVTGITSRAQSGSLGNAGMVMVTVEGLVELINGGQISSSTFAPGNAGIVEVKADKLQIANFGTLNQFTGITSQANPGSLGNAGMVMVTVEGLVELINGGQISSNTSAPGNAGGVVVKASELRIDDFGIPGQLTGISSQAQSGSLGDAGTVTVTVAGLLELINGGQISSSTFAQGNAGSVEVQAGELRIDGSGTPGQVTGIISLATRDATGLVGNVEVEAGTATILNGGAISIEARQTLPAGQLTEPIESRLLISADHLHLNGEANITAESTGNVPASAVEIHASDLLMEGESRITTKTNKADGGDIQITAPNLIRLQDSQITTAVGTGEGAGGNIDIDPEFVILANSQINANAFGGPGGNIDIVTDVFLADPRSQVTASSERSIPGEINIQSLVTDISDTIAPPPATFVSTAALLRDRCAARLREGQLSSLVVSGRAGMPARPGGVLPSPLFRAIRERMGPLKQAEPLAKAVISYPEADGAPDYDMRQGWMSFQHGDFEQAARHWQEAVRALEHEGKPHPQSVVLAHLAYVYQKLGHYQQALQSLQAAQTLAEKSGDQVLKAFILGELGNVNMPLGMVNQASQYLHDGLRLAREMKADDLVATVLNNLGNFSASHGRSDEALRAYRESAKLAQLTGNHALTARALTNAALITLRRRKLQEVQTLLDQVFPVLQAFSPSHEKAYGLVSIGLIYVNLRSHLPTMDASLLQLAWRSFNDAIAVAQATSDARAASYAQGYLGSLYEEEGRYQEALALTRRALFAIQHVQALEAAYQWQWQTGRILKALGQSKAAMAAYSQAVETLQAMRHEMLVAYGEPLRFRETVGPVYAEFVDLLLQPGAAEEALEEARQLLESLKVAELQNHFQDECVAALQLRDTSLDEVSQTAIVIYPILLPDRTELLVSLPTGAGASKLQRFAVAIGADRLSEEVRALRQTLENRISWQYLRHAQTLYDWLIRPLEPALASLAATTLIFVPDGALRTIPMAALHDGEQFLIQKYALAITPGLNLTDPRPLPQPARVLAAGLTQSVQGFSPLPYVETELQAIAHLYKSDILLNQDFQVSSLEKILERGLFPIVHIATHGQFSSDLNNTFILAADGKLTLERLNQLLDPLRFSDEPIELLTLSACQTAAGDDEAALGLAGVAVKAGARSALATLWFINDQASSELVAAFYRHLRSPSVSRATALQRAQIHLLGDPNYQHPAYWAPFLLINNWL